MPKFDETENILELYMYLAGKSEVPDTWHKWTCISIVAACLSDRVFYRKLAHKVLPPNMYTMLVGSSGLGKGAAIDFGLQFFHPRMNLLYGGATKQALIDRMTKDQELEEEEIAGSKIFIVHDELGEAVGTGAIADSFIKAMTGWYGQTSMAFEENTRMHGRKVLSEPPCINWLAGTTHEWLKDSIDVKAMLSGFFGRVCTIPGECDYSKRIYRQTTPLDYDIVKQYLQERFYELTFLEGEFQMLPAAQEIDEYWYMNRPNPEEEMAPFWRREHALVLKLAMIMSACDSLDRTIQPTHIVQAQDLIAEVKEYMPVVIEKAVKGGVLTLQDRVKKKIFESHDGIRRTALVRYIFRYGAHARDLDEIIKQLKASDSIEEEKRYNKCYYVKKKKPIINWGDIIPD